MVVTCFILESVQLNRYNTLRGKYPWNEISGSTGLAGAVDGALVLRKNRSSDYLYLYVDGRDIVDQQEIALSYDKTSGVWLYEGTAYDVAVTRKQQEIHELIKQSAQGITAKEIAEKLGKNLNTAKNLIQKLKQDNYIYITSIGKYIATTKPTDQEVQATRDALSEKEEE